MFLAMSFMKSGGWGPPCETPRLFSLSHPVALSFRCDDGSVVSEAIEQRRGELLVAEADPAKIAHGNAEKLLQLGRL